MKFIDETNEQYHARREMSASMLKRLDESPRLFEAHYVARTIESKQSDALRLGSAVHAAILEPDVFHATYVVCPAECSDKRTTKHKEWAKTVEGREILTFDEWDRIKACCVAANRNEIAAMIIEAATVREKSFAYSDFLTSVDCRVRFDALAGDLIVDLKTVSDGSESAFVRSIADYRYHLQAAHYLEGFKTIDPSRDWQFVFITVETLAPFRCRVFKLDDEALMIAAERRTQLLESYKLRCESGDWSESGENEIVTLSLPNWYKSKASAI
jgi:exodeoxyribonuclease VIII